MKHLFGLLMVVTLSGCASAEANISSENLSHYLIIAITFVMTMISIFWFLHLIKKKGESKRDLQVQSVLFAVFIFITLIFLVSSIIQIIADENLFKYIGATIIICWIIVILGYYVWAIYFYNVNYGWQESDWIKHEERVNAGLPGLSGEPMHNPHEKDSLGLPPGTVRGTLAISLLVAGLAMTISALSMPDRYEGNMLIIDHFDFFKQAFLMMIAFYFGTKGLEILQKGGSGKISTTSNGTLPTSGLTDGNNAEDKKILPVQNFANQDITSAKNVLKKHQQEEIKSDSDFHDPTAKG